MKPIIAQLGDYVPKTYACSHWKSFPPPYSTSGLTAIELRTQGYIQETDYQRMLVWLRICGLTQMDMIKCSGCEHVRVAEIKDGLPVLTDLGSNHSVPAVDRTTIELNASRMQRGNK